VPGVKALLGGIDAWQEAKLPVVKGREPGK